MSRANHLISLILNEDRLPALQKKWGEKLNTSHDHAASTAFRPSEVVAHVANKIDPTPNKQYADKLLSWYHNGQFRIEDTDRVHNAVSEFHSIKHKLAADHAGPDVKNPKDLGSYPSIHHLQRAVAAHRQATAGSFEAPEWTKTTSKQREDVEHGSELIHDDHELAIRRVKTHEAMKVLGSNTEWCVVPSKHYFNDYHGSGSLYHIHEKKTGARKLLHFTRGQFMDEDDSPVDHKEFEKKYPVVKQVFKGHEESYDVFADPHEHDAKFLAGHETSQYIKHAMSERSTNPHVLHALANDRSPEVRLNVIKNNNTSSDTLAKVYDAHFSKGPIAAAFARNKNTPGHVLQHMVKRLGDKSQWHDNDYNSNVITRVAEHKNTSPELLSDIGHHSLRDLFYYNDDFARATGSTSNLARGQITRHGTSLAAVLSNPNTPEKFINYAVNQASDIDDHHTFTHRLAENPNVSSGVLDKLWKHHNGYTSREYSRAAVAGGIGKHPNASEELLASVAKQYPSAVAKRPGISPANVRHILDHKFSDDSPITHVYTMHHLLLNPSLTPGHRAEAHERAHTLLKKYEKIGETDGYLGRALHGLRGALQ